MNALFFIAVLSLVALTINMSLLACNSCTLLVFSIRTARLHGVLMYERAKQAAHMIICHNTVPPLCSDHHTKPQIIV